MIQRIQSIFLLLIAVLGIFIFVLPIFEFSTVGGLFEMNAYHTKQIPDASSIISNNIGIGATQGLIIILALITLFLYKKRQLQIKLCKLNILLLSIQIAAIVMYIDVAKAAILLKFPEESTIHLKIGAFIPIATLLLSYLSIRFIKKDEDLIRAADRLR